MTDGYKIDKGFMWVREPKIPSEYQEVEWIQSSGTQYIDTGVIAENKYIVNSKFVFISLGGTSEDLSVLGSSGTSRPSYMRYIQKRGYSGHYWSQMVGSDYSTATWSNPSVAANTEYTVEAKLSTSGNYLTVNGTKNTWSYSSAFNTGYSMYIFGSNSAGTFTNQSSIKLFYLKISDLSENPVRDFVPCYRKSDNAIGMYDMVEGKFYANSGTGTFSKGNDVAPTYVFKEKQFYPGAIWRPNTNTLLYLPLESDFVDRSGQPTTRVFSTNSSYPITYTTVGGLQSAHIGTSGGLKLTAPYGLQSDLTKPITVSMLLYKTSISGKILDMAATNSLRQYFGFENNQLCLSVYNHNNDSSYAKIYADLPLNQWVHIVYTITTSSCKLYVNGELKDSGQGNPTYPWGLRPYSHDNTQGIFCTRDSGYSSGLNGNARELIFEEVEWSGYDVLSYYNWIKEELGF